MGQRAAWRRRESSGQWAVSIGPQVKMQGGGKKQDVSLAEQRSALTEGMSAIRGSVAVPNAEEDEEDYWANIDVKALRLGELKASLEARGLPTDGKKRDLQIKLQQSVQQEKNEELEGLAVSEAARRAEAALEEAGSVYTCGGNGKGQLGLGENDRDPRGEFTVVMRLRGKGVVQVAAGGNIAMALAQNGNVFSWGAVVTGDGDADDADDGRGRGQGQSQGQGQGNGKRSRRRGRRSGEEKDGDEDGDGGGKPPPKTKAAPTTLKGADRDGVCVPVLIGDLQGEQIVRVATGPNHSGGVSDGGDLYMWGDGTRGQLGNGESLRVEPEPVMLDNGIVGVNLAVGKTHTLLLTHEAQLHSFGGLENGKLGHGIDQRHGVPAPANKFVPVPTPVPALATVKVLLLACSANHSAVVAQDGVYSWGSGDGGKLGHGDTVDRAQPARVEALAGAIVIDLSVGVWHSAAVLQVPPVFNGGWLYTWGTGHQGQLAQGEQKQSLLPRMSHVSRDLKLGFVKIDCGPFHCLGMTVDRDLYSWGLNKHGQLGRDLVHELEEHREHTPVPGLILGFNSVVDRVGRGNVLSFACGDTFSIVCTAKYVGETEEEVALRLEGEAEERMLQMQQHLQGLKEQQEARDARDARDADAAAATAAEAGNGGAGPALVATEPGKKLNGCDDCDCPGFEASLFRPNECKECKHLRKRHTKPPKHTALTGL